MGKVIFYSTTGPSIVLPDGYVLGGIIFTVVVALAIYALRSIGVFTLAKRNGVKKAWMAWLPGLWIYPVCMLIGEYRFFGRTYKSLAVIFTVIITACEVISIVYEFLTYFPLVGYFFSGGMVYFGEGANVLAANVIPYWTGDIYVTNAIRYPYPNVNLVVKMLNISSSVTYLLSFAEVLITLNAYIALFRKFMARNYMVAAVMSFFGLFPFFVFAIRKNRPNNFASYRATRQNYYTVNTPRWDSSNRGERSPFDEYPNNTKGQNEDPFEEFSDKNR